MVRLVSSNVHTESGSDRIMYSITARKAGLSLRVIASIMIVMIISAVVFTLPVRVEAATVIDNGDYVFQVLGDKKSAKIIQYKGKSLYVTLPSSVDSYEITSVGASAFMSNKTIKELEISNTIKTIESNAFYGCTALQKLQIPGNVEKVEDCAFSDCTALKSVEIYDGTVSIGRFAFAGCASLSELKLPNSIDVIDDFAFFNCTSLGNVSIPRSVSRLGGYILEGTSWMKNQNGDFVVIGDGVLIKYNGREKSRSIPDNIKQIGEFAFAENKEIDTILISPSVTRVGRGAFQNCKGLKAIGLPESLTEIADRAFYGCESLASVTIPSSITKLNSETFGMCTGLTTAEIPSTVSTLGEGLFDGCKSLRTVKMQNGLQVIEKNVFAECTSMGRLVFPESLKELKTEAVKDCISLTRVEFNGDTKIAANAFTGCKRIKEVVFYRNPTSIADRAFNGSPELKFFSDNSLYVEEYAKKSKLGNENIRSLSPYVDQGVMTEADKKQESGFSGSYTFIVVMIIIVDVGLIILFSFYILFFQPKGKKTAKRGALPDSAGRERVRDISGYAKTANSEKSHADTSPARRRKPKSTDEHERPERTRRKPEE